MKEEEKTKEEEDFNRNARLKKIIKNHERPSSIDFDEEDISGATKGDR